MPIFLFQYNIYNINESIQNIRQRQRNISFLHMKIESDVKNQPYKSFLNTNKKKRATTPFPIDLVYTWVDGRDEKWLNEFINASEELGIVYEKEDFLNRFVDIEELRFSLRSVEMNLPFIHKIFVVTWGDQRPYWLEIENPRIKLISQKEIFPKNIKLPTFNSKSIDFSLYKIPGLSEHFIYSNDDMYFSKPLKYTDFFTADGKPVVYSKNAKWFDVDKKYRRFKNAYKSNKNDGVLFMVSVYYTIITFRKKFKTIMKYEYSHIPTPFTKTICEEVYFNFKNEVDKTISHRFRSPFDLQMQTIMIQYGLFKNKSIVKPISNEIALFVIGSRMNRKFRRLGKISKNLPKMMSINVDEMKYRERTKAFLDLVFYKKSSFELADKPPSIDEDYKQYYAKSQKIDLEDIYLFIVASFNTLKKLYIKYYKKLKSKAKKAH